MKESTVRDNINLSTKYGWKVLHQEGLRKQSQLRVRQQLPWSRQLTAPRGRRHVLRQLTPRTIAIGMHTETANTPWVLWSATQSEKAETTVSHATLTTTREETLKTWVHGRLEAISRERRGIIQTNSTMRGYGHARRNTTS